MFNILFYELNTFLVETELSLLPKVGEKIDISFKTFEDFKEESFEVKEVIRKIEIDEDYKSNECWVVTLSK